MGNTSQYIFTYCLALISIGALAFVAFYIFRLVKSIIKEERNLETVQDYKLFVDEKNGTEDIVDMNHPIVKNPNQYDEPIGPMPAESELTEQDEEIVIPPIEEILTETDEKAEQEDIAEETSEQEIEEENAPVYYDNITIAPQDKLDDFSEIKNEGKKRMKHKKKIVLIAAVSAAVLSICSLYLMTKDKK
jgi:hypothetical protein